MPLPLGTEPLILADGRKIDPRNGEIITESECVEVPSNSEIQQDIVVARRRLSDLPVPPEELHTLSVVLSYKLLGVTDDDVAVATGLTVATVKSVLLSDAYLELKTELIQSLINSDLDNVRSLFVQKSRVAADRVIRLVNSESEHVAISAAKDILDRAGHRPADVIEHRHKHEGGLVIQYVDKKDKTPVIDITPSKEM